MKLNTLHVCLFKGSHDNDNSSLSRVFQTKVKSLRQDYVKERDRLRKSGSGASETASRCPFYEEINEVLGCRPISSPKYHASSSTPPTQTRSSPASPQPCSSGTASAEAHGTWEPQELTLPEVGPSSGDDFVTPTARSQQPKSKYVSDFESSEVDEPETTQTDLWPRDSPIKTRSGRRVWSATSETDTEGQRAKKKKKKVTWSLPHHSQTHTHSDTHEETPSIIPPTQHPSTQTAKYKFIKPKPKASYVSPITTTDTSPSASPSLITGRTQTQVKKNNTTANRHDNTTDIATSSTRRHTTASQQEQADNPSTSSQTPPRAVTTMKTQHRKLSLKTPKKITHTTDIPARRLITYTRIPQTTTAASSKLNTTTSMTLSTTNTTKNKTNSTTETTRTQPRNTLPKTQTPPPISRTTTTRHNTPATRTTTVIPSSRAGHTHTETQAAMTRTHTTNTLNRPRITHTTTCTVTRPTTTHTSPVPGTSRGATATLEETSDDEVSARRRRNQAPTLGGDGRRRQRGRQADTDLLSELTLMRTEDAEHRRRQQQMWERYLDICERQTRNREEENRYFHQWMQRQETLNDELNGHLLSLISIVNEAVNQGTRPPAYPPPYWQYQPPRDSAPPPAATPAAQGAPPPLHLAGRHGAFQPTAGVFRPTPLHAQYMGQPHVPPGQSEAPSPAWIPPSGDRGYDRPPSQEGAGFLPVPRRHTGVEDEFLQQGQGYAGVGGGRILHQRDSDEDSPTF